jgi:cytochrome bd-type quinol oxidase subunit 1
MGFMQVFYSAWHRLTDAYVYLSFAALALVAISIPLAIIAHIAGWLVASVRRIKNRIRHG